MAPGETILIRNGDEEFPIKVLEPRSVGQSDSLQAVTLIVESDSGDPSETLIEQLRQSAHKVVVLKISGRLKDPAADPSVPFYSTYNRTLESIQIQKILTTIAYLRTKDGSPLNMVGTGEVGVYVLLAQAYPIGAASVVADAGQFENQRDEQFLKRLPLPGIRRVGDFQTAAAVSEFPPLLIHGTGGKFDPNGVEALYKRFAPATRFRAEARQLENEAIADWLAR